jgi:hypothetical protein
MARKIVCVFETERKGLLLSNEVKTHSHHLITLLTRVNPRWISLSAGRKNRHQVTLERRKESSKGKVFFASSLFSHRLNVQVKRKARNRF